MTGYLTKTIDPNGPPSWVVVHDDDADDPITTTLDVIATDDAVAEAEELLGSTLVWVDDSTGLYDSYHRWGVGNGVWIACDS